MGCCGVDIWIPKIDDTVTTTLSGHSGEFIVIRVDIENKTADLQSLPRSKSSPYILASVRWNEIRSVADNQSGLAS
jgi:hypothetical protein